MKLDIVQVAYHVTDVHRAATDMVTKFGAGPFFVNENITLSWGEHRGEPTDFVHSSAFGQWGRVMVELFRQENDTLRSPYRDMFSVDEEGLHHSAIMVPDMNEAFDYFESIGLPVVTRCGLSGSERVDFAFVDARALLGHMIEIYPRSAGLVSFYDMVESAANGWDGRDPIRMLR